MKHIKLFEDHSSPTLEEVNTHIQKIYPYLEIAHDEDDNHYYWYSSDKDVALYLAGLPETTVSFKMGYDIDEWMHQADEILKDYDTTKHWPQYGQTPTKPAGTN